MAIRREMIKKRYKGPDATEIPTTQDADTYIDIKKTKRTLYERGRGPAFQGTRYTHIFEETDHNEDRKYDDILEIKKTTDESALIEYSSATPETNGVLTSVKVSAGRGPSFQETRVTFANDEDNTTRQVRVKTIEGGIDVERIDRWQNEWGRGPSYQMKRQYLNNLDEDLED